MDTDPIRDFINDEVQGVDDLSDGKSLTDDRKPEVHILAMGINPRTGDLDIILPDNMIRKCDEDGTATHWHVTLASKAVYEAGFLAMIGAELLRMAIELRELGGEKIIEDYLREHERKHGGDEHGD